MEKRTQVSVAMENTPGQLGRVCRVLAQADVNIRGICVADASDVSVIRLLVSDTPAAERALRQAGLTFSTQDVILVELDDRPGALEDVALRLGQAGVNLLYVYGAANGGEGRTQLVLRVS
ncbi:MAG: ACT domain-containing protein, partial [Phycisphaerae bacterium]